MDTSEMTVASAPPAASDAQSGEQSFKRANSIPLDQWRGLALLLVLISHGFYFTGRVHGIGRVGVNLFFFISGVLVFRSLARPQDASAASLAGKFWKRRLRRLYPALASYLVAMLPVIWLLQDHSPIPNSDIRSYLGGLPFAFAYATNYGPPQSAMSLGHLWSLSCEMQFYLLAPVIFLLGGASRARRAWVWGTLLAILLAAGIAGPLLDPEGRYKYHFEVAVWPMMLGFACEYKKSWWQRLSPACSSILVRFGLFFFVGAIALMLVGLEMKKLVIAAGALVLVPCFLAHVNSDEMPGIAGKMFAWLGERTYSIYLWQQPFTICSYLPPIWHPLGAVISALFGGLWFRIFERPFLSAGRRH